MSRKGFTLIELIVVISAIAILAGIIVPTVGTLVDDAKVNKMKAECNTLISACLQFDNKVGYIPFGTTPAAVNNYPPTINVTTQIDNLINYTVTITVGGVATTYNFREYLSKRIGLDPWATGYGYYEAVGVNNNNNAGVVGSYGPDRVNGPGAGEWTAATWTARTDLASNNRGTYVVFKTNR